VHVEDTVDPVRDIEIINEELLKKDIEWVESRIPELEKVVARVDKTKKKDLDITRNILAWMKEGKSIRSGDWKQDEVEVLNDMLLITAKPMIYLLNMSETDYIRKKNKWLPKIKEFVDAHGGEPMIPLSCEFEAKIASMSPEEAAAYQKQVGAVSILPKIIKAGYSILQLLHFFTAGADEVRAWSVRVLLCCAWADAAERHEGAPGCRSNPL
jgi:obg-like ATPase 1